ncbi:hypothetical protein [Paenibacillus sp. IHBB 10380]|uniref:hypothetical protein n=1 Tax=Paenibacillus sp. IHBB 10380 TaxID=1566358 RepID=UPI0005CFEC2C|nr:hypothetical protein [Paenibacillus sp. IHBB 10380]AJS59657.1 hypothetical protein UB51_15555 [Paenibacillus sp. IHBB 10380]
MANNQNQNQNQSKQKVQENYKTPDEKFNAEFAEDNGAATPKIQKPNKVQENYKTPNEKSNS